MTWNKLVVVKILVKKFVRGSKTTIPISATKQ